ncbi:MAG: 16S rRNA (guanine(966)-N(2))-methyltransferase RsmD [Acidobacteriota bacterium]
MRIIAGKYRGRQLKSPPSAQTRPTSDRLRETLFNVLAPRIKGARFLDLCAGTGAVGIEALSRGAEHVTFVDQSRKMCALIEANTGALGIDKNDFKVVNADAADYLRLHAKKEPGPFDIVFFDPPYAADYYSVVNLISDTGGQLLTLDAVVIVEHHRKQDLADDTGRLKRYRTLKQGDSALSFYRIGQ